MTDQGRRHTDQRRVSTDALVVVIASLLTILTLGTLVAVVVSRRDAAQDVARASYMQDVKKWRELQTGCERTKTDRTATAVALRAQSVYLNLVLDAASVKADVKRAALVAQRAFDESAGDLESRTGRRLNCRTAYPRPVPPDGVPAVP